MTNYDIFISYSRNDAAIVDGIVSVLERQGFVIWIDKQGVESGDAFKRIIVKAIEDSTCVLFFSSASSNLSKWTAKEIGVAVYENKTIIPILIDKSKYNPEIKFDLINLDYIDYTVPELRTEMLAKLIKALHSKCQKHNNEIDIDATYQTNSNNSERAKNAVWRDNLAKFFKTFFYDFNKRNPFVNFILLTIQVLAILSLISGINGTVWSFSLLDSPEWSFTEIYGKGFIPGLLMSLSIVICNGMILKWNRNGFYWLVTSFVLIFTPTIWNEFEEFIYFSVFSMLGVAVYFVVLLIRHNGTSTWKLCKMQSKSIRSIFIGATIFWAMLLVFFPVLMGKATGFSDQLYKNGLIAIDARFNGSAYYVRRLANKLALQNNDNSIYSASGWYQKAIYESEHDCSKYSDDISRECYVDYIYYLIKNNQKKEAMEYIRQASAKFGLEAIKKEIEDDTNRYDRNPYREDVLRCLSVISRSSVIDIE